MCVCGCGRARISVSKIPRNILYMLARAGADERNANERTERGQQYYIYVSLLPRARQCGAFSPRYNALVLARAGLLCVRYCIYVYRYRYCLFRLWLVVCGVLVLSVRSVVGLCLAFLLVLFVSCRALLSVVIWCNRVTMRYNRFYVLGGVVLPRALSCDCGAFSCLCGRAGGLCCCVYGCMQTTFVLCGGVYMYLCIMRLWLVWWCGADGLLVWIDIYNGLFRLCLRLCVSIG